MKLAHWLFLTSLVLALVGLAAGLKNFSIPAIIILASALVINLIATLLDRKKIQ